MTQYPQDRPSQASMTDDVGGVGQPGPGIPAPYAGSPGTPMPQYDRAASAGPRDHQGALIAFILGIFSVVGFSIVGPVAWVMASRALTEMDRPDGPGYTNRGLAVAAKVLGIIGTVLLGLSIVALIVFAVFTVTAVRRNGA